MAEPNRTNTGAEYSSTGERIALFVQNNRRKLFAVLGCAAAALAVFIGALVVRDTLAARNIGRVEGFTERYDALRFTIAEESSAEDVAALLAELSAFAPGASGYAGSRAYALIAGIRGDKKEWAEAEQAWREAAKKAGKKSYLAPVALFNAAAAAEEQGKIPEAIALYAECLAVPDSFPSAPRAQFAIGRLEEKRENREGALEAYRALRATWPNDTMWKNLAQSRIIALGGGEG
ncbi:MAG: tetratricopeptide repeat protein [Treponema sp.]|jgi:tetratricopeptide (TPR) repeat protein|nr:tetratricopeptide repeat protein [Treponema sp.]